MTVRGAARATAVGNVVKDVLLAIESAQTVSEENLLDAWREAAGELGFKNSRPHALSRGVLSVMVKNSSWSQELSLNKRWVLKKLQTALGKDRIQDIRFKTGQL